MIINLDKPREVKLTVDAMIKFHEETGIDLENTADRKKIKVKELRLLLWLCVQNREDRTLKGRIKHILGIEKDLTLENIGKYVDVPMLKMFSDAVGEEKGKN